MRQKSLHYLFLLVMLGVGFTACKSDVDLSSVSVDSKVSAKVSLPVGEISANFGELIGLVADKADISIDENGILYVHIKEHRDGEYHAIDLKRYLGQVESSINVAPIISPMTAIPASYPMDVPFDLIISFAGINDDTSDERLDSLVIEKAQFTVNVTTRNLAITDNDITKVTMKLGQQFRRAKGKEIELPKSKFRLGQDVDVDVDDFTLVMMADETQEPSNSNIVNNADIQFILSLNTGEDVAVSSSSAIAFSFKVKMMEYSALYGYFDPDIKETAQKDKVEIPLKLPGDEPLIIPLKYPEVGLKFTYGLSIPLSLAINELKGVSRDGSEHSAYWGKNSDSTHVIIPLENMVALDAPVTASVTDSSVLLNHQPEHGHIDTIFRYDIKQLAYDFKLNVDKERKINGKLMNQYRLTKNTKYDMDMRVNMPFIFNENLHIAYADTIKNVNLEKASLDSLAAQVDIVDTIEEANLDLYLIVTNEMPVSITLDGTFLDENDNIIRDKEGNEALNFLKDLYLEGADINGDGTVTPVVSTPHKAIKTEEFEALSKTKSIKIRARVGDDKKPSTFYSDKKISIKVGVTADLQAVLNLSLNTTNNK